MSKKKIDPRELRSALGAFVTGVTVVTTRDKDGTPRGFTANSFTSVSLDPPLVLVCLAKTAGSYDVFARSSGYAVNILAESQRDVSTVFTTDRMDRFDQVEWQDGPAGHPVFENTSAWLDCTMHSQVDAGDHMILIGEVQGFSAHGDAPLGYCRGAYVTFGLEQEAVAASGRNARIGAILEHDASIFLMEGKDGTPSLPSGRCLGEPDDSTSLHGVLKDVGLDADLGFLFAVFEEQTSGHLNIFYRGTVEDAPSDLEQGRFVPFDNIDPNAFGTAAERSMMTRYLSERTEAQFGIYVGDNERGRVHAIAETLENT